MNNSSLAAECNNPFIGYIDADPDIVDIGVLVAFAVSTWITLLFCVIHYCINSAVSFTDHVGQDAPVHPIDKLCLDKLDALWTRIGRKPSDKWAEALEKAVLGFSDQQCITGIAILLSGYSQLSLRNKNPITVYNWQIAVDLVWFSLITYLITLICFRHYFRQRRALSMFRIACMAVNAVILAVSIGSTGWQLANQGVPALCLFDTSWIAQDAGETFPTTGVYNDLYTAITAIFLAFSYLTRIIQLCPEKSMIRRWFNISVTFTIAVSDRLRKFVRDRVLQSSKRLFFVHKLVYRLVLTVHYVLKVVFDLYSSMLWEITWLLIALAWGSLRVRTDRLNLGIGHYAVPVLPPGNSWGFGQVIAIILLLLPLISFFEVVYDTIFLHETPSLSANPINTINITALSMNAQHNPSPDQDLYRHRWLRMVILLLYSLSLAVAADLLLIFPYEGSAVTTVSLSTYQPALEIYSIDSTALVIHYAEWFSLNIALLGAFTFLVISNSRRRFAATHPLDRTSSPVIIYKRRRTKTSRNCHSEDRESLDSNPNFVYHCYRYPCRLSGI